MKSADESVSTSDVGSRDAARRTRQFTPGLSDGLGDRLLTFDQAAGTSLQLLRLKREFSDWPGFEAALRSRVDELNRLHHPSLAPVRSVEWLDGGEGLALISSHTAGRRLSEILPDAHGSAFALEFIRQVAPVLAALHQQGPDVAHGMLTPDRVVVTREGRLVITEHTLGSAVESLWLPIERLRSELRLAVLPDHHPIRLDARHDVVQLGFVALALLVGRRLDPADYPAHVIARLDEFTAEDPTASARLRPWLERTLQLDARPFATATEAHEGFVAMIEPAGASRARPATADAASPQPRDRAAVAPPSIAAVPATRESASSAAGVEPSSGTSRAAIVPGLIARDRQLDVARAASDVHDAAQPSDVAESPNAPAPANAAAPADATIAAAEDSAASTDVSSADAPVARPRRTFRWIALAASAACAAAAFAAGAWFLPVRDTPKTIDARAGTMAAASAVDHRSESAPPATDAVTTPAQDLSRVAAATAASANAAPRTDAPATVPALVSSAASSSSASAASAPASDRPGVAAPAVAAKPASEPAAGATIPATAAPGSIIVTAPIDLQVFEGGVLVGSTSAPLTMAEGTHTLDLVNDALGFRVTETVAVRAGAASAISVSVPNGSLSINAVPWADVAIDGKAAGETPLANVAIPIGTHDVVFHHPTLGEQHRTVVVKAGEPARVSADLTEPARTASVQ